jgi:large subunit ribosomal protein L24
MAKIKTGDTVYVISGDFKGVKGRVLRVDPKAQRAVVEGAGLKIRHTKPSAQNPEGGRVRREHPIHMSNMALVDPAGQEGVKWTARLATRVGFRMQDGKKVRYAKRSGEVI